MEQSYSTEQVCSIVNGRLLQPATTPLALTHLLLDSRSVLFSGNSIYFAIRGPRHDGHRYLGEVHAQGVRCLCVSEDISPDDYPGAAVIRVDDTLRALQDLVAFHRTRFPDLCVIGITGSNGKTIVKEWLFRLLQSDFAIVRSPKSFNSQVGVPLSVWQIQPYHTLGIFEAGISQPGEMEHLAGVIRCSIGLMTNIGDAHNEGFESMDQKISEKLRLFEPASVIVYGSDDERLDAHMRRRFSGKRLLTWSKSGRPATLSVERRETLHGNTTITAGHEGRSLEFTIPMVDEASVENALSCCLVLLHLGIEAEQIRRRMAQLEPVAMRLEIKSGINGCLVINDAYNADLTSLAAALQVMEQRGSGMPRTLILSDILESGQPSEMLYRQVARLVTLKHIGRVLAIGQEVQRLRDLLPAGIHLARFPTTEAFLNAVRNTDFNHEVILIKGARRFGLEKVAARLELKAHKTVLEINLNALVHNLNTYRRLLQPATRLMVMVKAGAYGSGSDEVAKLLEYQKVAYLAVAYADEGIELRNAGVQLPVMVLNPDEGSFEALLRYRLEPELYSLPLLRQFLEFSTARGIVVPIHLKMDTGMHRLGFMPADIPAVNELLRQYPQVRVASVFSHLAASESAEHDAFTRRQAERFAAMYTDLSAALGYAPLRHLLNSGGIVRFPQYQMDMVRLGIGLYGVDSSVTIQHQLQVVNTLKATVSQIKVVPVGETVGYGRRGHASHPIRIAVISIGYADGLLRKCGNGAYSVCIRGKRAPLIGNVCMDMSMADVTHIPQVQEGDEVIVFGQDPPVEELARCLQTIPYEVFTSIAARVKRVYYQE